MSKAIAAFKLIRPLNGVVAALSVVPAATIACGSLTIPWRESGLIFFLVSFGYAVNDIFDVRTDSINRPSRALPSRSLAIKHAWLTSVLSLILGSGLLIGASTPVAVYYVGIAVLLYSYAARVSSWLIAGNVLVAGLCASVFLLGALICPTDGREQAILVACSMLTFLYHLGREIVKDIEDVAGDKAILRSTLALKWGVQQARIAATAIFALLIGATYLTQWLLGLSVWFLPVISFGVNLPLALIFVIYWRRDAIAGAGAVSLGLKVIMIPALLAIMLATVN